VPPVPSRRTRYPISSPPSAASSPCTPNGVGRCEPGCADPRPPGCPPTSARACFRLYEPGLIPGIFQTAQYAAAVISSFMKFSGIATDLEEAVAGRMEWQKIIYSEREFRVVLEEQPSGPVSAARKS